MGAVCSTDVDEAEADRSRRIDKELERDREKQDKQKKVLLLGAAECGKTTVLKQVRIMLDTQWEKRDTKVEKIRIFENLVHGAAQLYDGAVSMHIIISREAEEHGQLLKSILSKKEAMESISSVVKSALQILWADPKIREVYALRSRLQLADSVSYYLNSLERICADDYAPTNEDVLHIRVPTTGVVEHHLDIKGFQFTFIDVGGQRSDRRKWFHHFSTATSVLFISAISEFDQMSNEDNKKNRLTDSLEVYKETVENKLFEEASGTPFILFLNKTDLFREKILNRKSIKTFFKDYEGLDTVEESLFFIQQAFLALSPRPPYLHRTCATDTDQVQKVIRSVIDSIITKNLASVGFVQ